MPIRDHLEEAVANNPDKIFLYFEDEEITYQALDTRVNKRANYFLDLGIQKGDTVALVLLNGPEYLYSWFALAKIGAILIPVNTSFKENETEYILNHSEAKLVVCSSQFTNMIEAIRSKCKHLIQVISIDKTSGSIIGPLCNLVAGFPGTLPRTKLSSQDVACIMYTSGTTGAPKGCVLPNAFYTLTARNWADACSIKSSEKLMTFLPLFHMAAQTTTTMATLLTGASLILVERFSASEIWGQIRRYEPAIFSYIGAVLSFLEALPASPDDQSHSVTRLYGGGASGEQIERFEKRFGPTVVEGYGSTEDGLVLSNAYRKEPRRIGSVGKSCPGYEVRIVDGDDKPLPAGQIGEVVVKGGSMMLGYFKDDAATAEAMKGGWFHTGDNGCMDTDGFFYFHGRIKDIIRRSGENISTMEVEDLIRSHPKVLDVAVLGIADSIRGEEVMAHIILQDGETKATMPFKEIISYCTEKLAYFKVPRYLQYHKEDFPRTQTGRVKKHELAQKEAQSDADRYDRQNGM